MATEKKERKKMSNNLGMSKETYNSVLKRPNERLRWPEN